jgi:hypothetical protein
METIREIQKKVQTNDTRLNDKCASCEHRRTNENEVTLALSLLPLVLSCRNAMCTDNADACALVLSSQH